MQTTTKSSGHKVGLASTQRQREREMSLPALDKSSVFLLEALVVWMALCLPGNIVTLVLYNRANSGDEGAAAEADQEVSDRVVQK